MEYVKPRGNIVDPDWIPSFEFHTSSRRKRKRLVVMKGMLRNEKPPWGFRYLPKVVSGDPGNSGSCKRKRQTHDFSSQIEVTPAMDRARIVMENLDGRYPSFVKPMIPSNVTGGFWLSLPKSFCNLHLPKRDTVYLLVDEKGQEYNVKYLADRMGFSGGWRGFSIAHKLLEEDVLVFHFVGNYKIKVYIVRVKSLDKVDAALTLLHLSAQLPKMDSDCVKKDITRINQFGEKQARPVAQVLTHSFQKDSRTAPDDQFRMALDQPKSDATQLGLVVLEGIAVPV